MKEHVDSVTQHPLLGNLPETADLKKKFAHVSIALNDYEVNVADIWMNHNASIY